jgi:glycosyltransferase involved in cell wall biosynthesis
MGMIKVIMVAYQRIVPLRIAVDSFLNQSDDRWELYVIHDGQAPEVITEYMSRRTRIQFSQTAVVNGKWGHPNRRSMLEKIEAEASDYILITNDDNYYIPGYVKLIQQHMNPGVGMIYYNTLHSYFNYTVHTSQLKVGRIDMGAFVVRADVAKAVGFKHDKEIADGMYCEDCASYCTAHGLQMVYIPGIVPFIHN